MTDDDAIKVLRAGAPRARRAAWTAWQAALAWTWLAWRLTVRVWLVGAAELAGMAVGMLVIAGLGLCLACYACARGFGGLALDGWRWLWRRA